MLNDDMWASTKDVGSPPDLTELGNSIRVWPPTAAVRAAPSSSIISDICIYVSGWVAAELQTSLNHRTVDEHDVEQDLCFAQTLWLPFGFFMKSESNDTPANLEKWSTKAIIMMITDFFISLYRLIDCNSNELTLFLVRFPLHLFMSNCLLINIRHANYVCSILWKTACVVQLQG